MNHPLFPGGSFLWTQRYLFVLCAEVSSLHKMDVRRKEWFHGFHISCFHDSRS
jgi:hypothetical protein